MRKQILLIMIVCLFSLCIYSFDLENLYRTNTHFDQTEETAYDINDLRCFFVERHLDRPSSESYTHVASKILFYDEVNSKFPVEMIKTKDSHSQYTIYRVRQGGYYYVFWSYAWPQSMKDNPRTREYMCVVFSAYIGNDTSNIDYYEVKPERTTMEFVINRDPNTEYISLSQGVFTCSLLDNSTILQIQYVYKGNDEKKGKTNYESWVVKKASIVPIDKSVSRLASVLLSDLP